MANKREEISNEIAKKLVNMLYIVIILLIINLAIGISSMAQSSEYFKSNGTSVNKESDNTVVEYDVSKYTAIDYSGFTKAKKASGYQVIYIGRSSCGYCTKFIPVMNQVQSDYGFTHLYYDITQLYDYVNNEIVDEKAYNELIKENDFYKENLLSTPMVVVYKDGKYVSGTVGYQSAESYAKFIEDAGIKKN